MRAKYKIDDTQLALGPSNINETLPQDGEFKPSRGRAISFPGVYFNGTRVANREQQWVWDLLIEGTSTYDALVAINHAGDDIKLETKYGEHISTWETYSGQVSDCLLELHEGMVFKGNKRGYRCTLIVNCHS